MINPITIPVTILDRKWENGITPAWAAIFSPRESGWLTIRPGQVVLQSFTRDKKGEVIAANILEVTPNKAELGRQRILRITGKTRGKTGPSFVDYSAAGNLALTLTVEPQHWNLLQSCFRGSEKGACGLC